MKKISVVAILILLTVSIVVGQENRYLSTELGIYAFPSEGQSSEQQLREEAECYNWAVDRSRVDPFDLQKRQQQEQQQAEAAKKQAGQVGQGATGQAAASGAVGGLLIGSIAGGKKGRRRGAAAGAAVGAIAGESSKQSGRKQAEAQVDAQAERQMQASAAEMEEFKKAFAACMESKEYIVR